MANVNSSGKRQTSRRAFIKAAGVATITIIAPEVTHPTYLVQASSLTQRIVPDDVIDSAIIIAKADPLFTQTIDELYKRKLEFSIDSKNIRISLSQDSVVGLVFEPAKSDSPRYSADLILTINPHKNLLQALQVIVAWCLDDRLHIESTIFRSNLETYIEFDNSKTASTLPSDLLSVPIVYSPATPKKMHPREVRGWDFIRPEQTEAKQANETDFGWPAESDSSCYWHYRGCTNAFWSKEENDYILKCLQVEEFRSCQSAIRNIQLLDYFDLTPPPLPLVDQQAAPQR